MLTTFAGSTGAGVSDYQGTLYLDGPASTVSGSSFQLTTVAGPGAPATPTTVAGLAGSGSLAMASYQYVYVLASGSGHTASAVSTPAVAVPANGSVSVSVSPLQFGGDLYRARTSSGVVLGNYVLASPPGGVTTVPYVDTGAVNGAALPQADTRHPIGAPGLGWSEFVPGTGLILTTSNSSISSSSPSLPSTCKGWVVDGSGGMSFPASNWTFQMRVKPGAINNGTAVLSAGMWRVDNSGATVGGYLITPTDGDVITNATGMALTATVTANPGAFSLGTGEHICIQFWRHQTVAYINGGTNHTISLLAYDPVNQVTVHPAPNGFAAAALSAPADGLYTTAIPTLDATYSDPDADAGTLTIRLCTDSGCSSSPQNSGAMAATDGATLNWTPSGPLADGTYYWQAQAQDALGLPSAWTSSRSFVIDSAPPATTITSSPPAQSNATSGSFSFSADEPATFECSVDGASFASCTSPHPYGPLGDAPHTFDVRATDLAGNVDASPASHAWTIDTVGPSTPGLISPADGLTINALPQLQATFDDATPGDIGTVEFQICSSSAPAGTACVPVVQSATSGPVSNGGTATVTPALPDGTHHWQARAQDAAGNQSGWSATRSFQLDTAVPAVPALGAPGDGAWVSNVQLSATFSKPSFAGMGNIEFRICSDALCLGIVRSGSSDGVINGGLAAWSPSTRPADGLYYWQARAHDSSGNVSGWSGTRSLHIDSAAPGAPRNFNGQFGDDGLTLRWEAPTGVIANYVLYVNGAPFKNLGGTELEIKMGAFDVGDTRSFSVVGVDLAGNVGTMSPVLVGVPSLVGLTWPEALGATSARGLALKRSTVLFAGVPMLVSKQDPAVPTLAARGTAVQVTMEAVKGAPLALRAKPGRFACAGGSVLRLRVQLSAPAVVRNRLLNARGKVVKRGTFGLLRSGTTTVRVKLSRGLRRGSYRLLLDATGEGGKARATVRVKVGARARVCRAR